jgi:hypothetical protein
MWEPGRLKVFSDRCIGRSPLPSFHHSMVALSSRACGDKRDKIYSMLPLATHGAYKGLAPDYLRPTHSVYTDVFERMVEELNGDLACFMGGGFGSPMEGLSSWVRDFSHLRPVKVAAIDERRIGYRSLFLRRRCRHGGPRLMSSITEVTTLIRSRQ